jgi:abortive infection bacteriophage resistance protein
MAKKIYDKPPLSIAEQVQKLLSRGLEGDPVKIERILSSINYYRLSGYTYPFRDHTNDHFQPGTSIDLIWDLYTFDQQLRLLCFKAIETCEVFLRKQLSYYHSVTTNDPFAYVNVNATDTLKHGRFLDDIQRAYTRQDHQGRRLVSSKDDFVIHFFNTYQGDHLPLWMMVEVVSFGTLVTYYRYYLPQAERETLSNTFGITPSIFNTWLSAIQEVRNICAHHGRLWNRRIRSEPLIAPLTRHTRQPLWHFMAGMPEDRTFAMLCVLNHCIRSIDPSNTWRDEIRNLFASHPEARPTRMMGTPAGWESAMLWN